MDFKYTEYLNSFIKNGKRIIKDNDCAGASNWLKHFDYYMNQLKKEGEWNKENPIAKELVSLHTNIYNLSLFGSGAKRDRWGEMMNLNQKNFANENKQTVKLSEQQLKKIIKESVKNVLNEGVMFISYPTMKELDNVLNKITKLLSKFSNNIPEEASNEFMRLVGKSWNNLWDDITSLREDIQPIIHQHGLSDGDLTFDDLS